MTTVPIDDPKVLRHILANTEALLLDFDGPVCSVFAGIPAHIVADQLRNVLSEGSHHDLPYEVATSADPFDVLKYAAALGTNEVRYVEATFRAYEVEAIATAKPTTGAHRLIRAWSLSRRPISIVSNNSAMAVISYLELHGLTSHVTQVSARDTSDIELLKPNSYLVDKAINMLNVVNTKATLLGDSTTDIEAGIIANVATIGFANKKGKVVTLTQSGATAVTTSIASLVDLL
ncbi:HAD family hydrolase [Kutzneria sp. 744]|uniref:HAD family hydrolase n=1 Tax=Kutzneria sp. (strain 744) TaxID=345341 RepID=UPI0003EEBE9A|nr:HAD hydrolase-like protein [Kutzneria sp. 744]EWM14465.1 hydrolase [Kutzneria sp. 744]